jgi:hypothetical protein
MPLVKVSPGQPFRPSAGAWNAFIDAADYISRRQALGSGAESVDEPDRLVVRAGWQEANPTPVFGLVRVMACYPSPGLSPILKCRLPGHFVGGCIGILAEHATKDAAPWVQIAGDSPILYDGSAGPLAEGHRLHSGTGYLAVPDSLGALQVIADLGAASELIPSGTWPAGARLAQVRIGEDKAAPKIVARKNGQVLGAFRTVIYIERRSALNPSPGLASVS